ncbi:MAG: hypothetical protein HMLKMBBP_03546 [Planctomycetes bacterium]|nr:hypothetical protein [Planctomycetota bacterium]
MKIRGLTAVVLALAACGTSGGEQGRDDLTEPTAWKGRAVRAAREVEGAPCGAYADDIAALDLAVAGFDDALQELDSLHDASSAADSTLARFPELLDEVTARRTALEVIVARVNADPTYSLVAQAILHGGVVADPDVNVAEPEVTRMVNWVRELDAAADAYEAAFDAAAAVEPWFERSRNWLDDELVIMGRAASMVSDRLAFDLLQTVRVLIDAAGAGHRIVVKHDRLLVTSPAWSGVTVAANAAAAEAAEDAAIEAIRLRGERVEAEASRILCDCANSWRASLPRAPGAIASGIKTRIAQAEAARSRLRRPERWPADIRSVCKPVQPESGAIPTPGIR